LNKKTSFDGLKTDFETLKMGFKTLKMNFEALKIGFEAGHDRQGLRRSRVGQALFPLVNFFPLI
jgi:hypothetical protein